MTAEYQVLPNGTSYSASIQVTDVNKYAFYDVGVMGEQVPKTVSNVSMDGPLCKNCSYNWSGSSAIAFDMGNYTIHYSAPLQTSELQGTFYDQYNVNVTLPAEFDVRNPFLGEVSSGANVTRFPDNTTLIRWNNVTYFDVRFYDQGREDLLFLFGNFWIVIAIVLLLPFALTMKKRD